MFKIDIAENTAVITYLIPFWTIISKEVRRCINLMQTILLWFYSHKWPLHVSDIYTSIFRSSYIYRLFHCRIWCYALGVVAVVLRSWCVFMCTDCQFSFQLNWQTMHMTTHQLRRITATMPICEGGWSSTKSYTNRHYRV